MDDMVAGRLFKKGAPVMLPALPHQMDTAIWGEDYGEFVADRFIRAEDKGGKFGNREDKCRGEVEEKDIETAGQGEDDAAVWRRGVTRTRRYGRSLCV